MIAFAYVNRGRWVADCPAGCPGLEGIGAEDARDDWFLCRLCCNGGRGPVPLLWPPPELVRAIEAALVVRPLKARNWNVVESLGALLAENVEHGLYDPVTGQVAGDIGADQMAVPALAALAGLALQPGGW